MNLYSPSGLLNDHFHIDKRWPNSTGPYWNIRYTVLQEWDNTISTYILVSIFVEVSVCLKIDFSILVHVHLNVFLGPLLFWKSLLGGGETMICDCQLLFICRWLVRLLIRLLGIFGSFCLQKLSLSTCIEYLDTILKSVVYLVICGAV